MSDYVVMGGKIFTISTCLFKFNNLNTYFYLKQLNKIQKYYVESQIYKRLHSFTKGI